MLSLLTALFHFVLTASDPHQACTVAHRDPHVAGTYYLYCSQVIGGVEVVDVGAFVPDVKRPHKATP